MLRALDNLSLKMGTDFYNIFLQCERFLVTDFYTTLSYCKCNFYTFLAFSGEMLHNCSKGSQYHFHVISQESVLFSVHYGVFDGLTLIRKTWSSCSHCLNCLEVNDRLCYWPI